MTSVVTTHGVALNRGLLTELCQHWEEPALKALVIETALAGANADRSRPSDEERLGKVIEQTAPRTGTSDRAVRPSSALRTPYRPSEWTLLPRKRS